MKVLAYMPTPSGLTGGPRRLLTLASVLSCKGIEMCIATRQDSDLYQAGEELGVGRVAVELVGVLSERQGALFGGNSVFRIKALVSLFVQNLVIVQKIRRSGAQVVWTRGSKGLAFAGLSVLLSRRPLVWDVDYELPSRGAVRCLHRLGLWAAKCIVFQYVSAPDAIFGSELASRYRPKFRTIIPGIDLPSLETFRIQRMARDRREAKPFVMLQVGTICDRKNQAIILEALRFLQINEIPGDRELWLAYDEIQTPGLLDRVRDYKLEQSVKFLGWRDDIKGLMAEVDVLVMPSEDEGVPNAVQEAMAIGVPVLASKAGGMPEIIRDGATGWIIDLDDLKGWAECIRKCSEDPLGCEAIGNNAAAYAAKHFGVEKWGDKYAQLLEEAASTPNAAADP